MTVGSLFSGIGGFEKGFEDAGFRTIWQCEQDDFCTQVLNKHWPDVPVFRDVRELYTEGGESPEKPDVLIGGFPCQDISLAGKGAGLEGKRSGLWWEFYRIIGEVRPRYAVLENVAALVNRGLPAICGALSEIGYDAEWEIVSAAALGAPHLRERLFLVAYPNGERCEKLNFSASGTTARQCAGGSDASNVAYSSGMGRQARCEEARRKAGDGSVGSSESAPMADAKSKRCRKAREDRPDQQEEWAPGGGEAGTYWTTQPRVCPLASRIPRRVDRIRAYGNAIVPQVAEYVGRLVMQHASQQQPKTP